MCRTAVALKLFFFKSTCKRRDRAENELQAKFLEDYVQQFTASDDKMQLPV